MRFSTDGSGTREPGFPPGSYSGRRVMALNGYVFSFPWILILRRIRHGGLYGEEDSDEEESIPKDCREHEGRERKSRTAARAR